MSKRTLGVVFFPAFDWAISPTHPEREERLLYTQDQHRVEGYRAGTLLPAGRRARVLRIAPRLGGRRHPGR